MSKPRSNPLDFADEAELRAFTPHVLIDALSYWERESIEGSNIVHGDAQLRAVRLELLRRMEQQACTSKS